MHNIKLTLQYDGTNFSGWELQTGKRTVRSELQKALFKVFKTKIKVISACRTDAGVHALGLIINFKVKHSIPITKVTVALNSCLPEDIRVVKAEEVDEDFNARFDAKSKEYEYLIYNGEILLPHLRDFVWQVKPKLNLSAMRKAARVLVGKHDFSSFCAAHSDDKDKERTLHKVSIRERRVNIWDGCQLSVVSCQLIGDGFLYKMVRNLVGTLVEVGLGRLTVADVRKILTAKDRRQAGRTAPAQGLCLVRVNY